jgi:hypothetical protein
MAETYIIAAAPMLFTEGQHSGRLNGVTFTATSATGKIEWFTIDCGHFEDAFTRLMTRGRARALVAALMEGDTIQLPGQYTEDQFERRFNYEWKAPHFVRSASEPQSDYAY